MSFCVALKPLFGHYSDSYCDKQRHFLAFCLNKMSFNDVFLVNPSRTPKQNATARDLKSCFYSFADTQTLLPFLQPAPNSLLGIS